MGWLRVRVEGAPVRYPYVLVSVRWQAFFLNLNKINKMCVEVRGWRYGGVASRHLGRNLPSK